MSFNRTIAAVLLAGAASLSAVAGAQAQEARRAFSGPYVGIVGAYSDGRYNFKGAPLYTAPGSTFFGAYGGQEVTSAPKLSANDYELGGTAGWSTRTGNWVAGFEGDFSWSNVEGALNVSDRPFAGSRQFTTLLRANTRWSATARARAGYVLGPVLAYGTAGFAAQSVNLHRDYRNAAGATIEGAGSRNYFGFTYGGGLEYAVSPKVSMKAEYLRFDTGGELFRTGYRDQGPQLQTSSATAKVEHDRDLYRIGFNYHF